MRYLSKRGPIKNAVYISNMNETNARADRQKAYRQLLCATDAVILVYSPSSSLERTWLARVKKIRGLI